MKPAGRPARPTAMSGRALVATGLVAGLLTTGCGSETTSSGGGDDDAFVDSSAPSVNLVPAGYDGRFRTSATVLESPEHGPQLCYAVLESFPPQCGGPDVAGWDWSDVTHESARGTRWGSYTVVGTFDGERFTLTEPPSVDSGTGRPGGDQLATPCPEPDGGWQPVDPSTATQAALDEAVRRAGDVAGFGGVWIDQRITAKELTERNANDPKRLVLNVTTAGDPEEMQRAVREVWGGSLCVSTVSRSEDALRRVQRELESEADVLSSGIDVVTAQVTLDVMVATEELQRDLDARYGEGTVRLFGALDPID